MTAVAVLLLSLTPFEWPEWLDLTQAQAQAEARRLYTGSITAERGKSSGDCCLWVEVAPMAYVELGRGGTWREALAVLSRQEPAWLARHSVERRK